MIGLIAQLLTWTHLTLPVFLRETGQGQEAANFLCVESVLPERLQ